MTARFVLRISDSRKLAGTPVDEAPSSWPLECIGTGDAQIIQRTGVGVNHAAGHGGIVEIGRVNELVGGVLDQALRPGPGTVGLAGDKAELMRGGVYNVTRQATP